MTLRYQAGNAGYLELYDKFTKLWLRAILRPENVYFRFPAEDEILFINQQFNGVRGTIFTSLGIMNPENFGSEKNQGIRVAIHPLARKPFNVLYTYNDDRTGWACTTNETADSSVFIYAYEGENQKKININKFALLLPPTEEARQLYETKIKK